MLSVTFKKALQEDLPIINKIEQSSFNKEYGNPYTLQELKELLIKIEVYLILNQSKPIGYYMYRIDRKNKIAEIEGVVILNKYQRQTIGTLSVRKILKDIKNCKKVTVKTHPFNIAAIKLYLKCGFFITGYITKAYDNKPRLIMEKNII